MAKEVKTLYWEDVEEGQDIPDASREIDSTLIISGANWASHDFMPVHHDPKFAQEKGAPDIFMNILTTNGYVSRFVTDWAGPEAMVRSIAIRLGAPAVPGKILRFTGRVARTSEEGDERIVELAICAANDLGDHATGTVVLSLPLVR